MFPPPMAVSLPGCDRSPQFTAGGLDKCCSVVAQTLLWSPIRGQFTEITSHSFSLALEFYFPN